MKKAFFFCGIILLSFKGFCQQAKKINLFDNKVEVSLPADWQRIGDSPDAAIFIFEDKSRSVKFTVAVSDEAVNDNEIPGYTDLAIASVKSESSSAKIYDDGISLNAGKNIGYIKYSYSKNESSLFEYVFYGSLNDKLLTLYFSCKPEDRSKWEKQIDTIVATLRINDKIIQ